MNRFIKTALILGLLFCISGINIAQQNNKKQTPKSKIKKETVSRQESLRLTFENEILSYGFSDGVKYENPPGQFASFNKITDNLFTYDYHFPYNNRVVERKIQIEGIKILPNESDRFLYKGIIDYKFIYIDSGDQDFDPSRYEKNYQAVYLWGSKTHQWIRKENITD